MKQDDFGDRMKGYERQRTEDRLTPGNVFYARLDGRGFSKFTKGLRRPFDPRMSVSMIEVMKYLVEKTNANMGYTQSDEISLVWSPNLESQMMFDGKVQKLTSVLASMATSKFMYELILAGLEDYLDKLPHFDCRIFELPTLCEGANAMLWREQDATKNAITMAASCHFSHKQLQGVSGKDKIRLMQEHHGIAFPDDYPSYFTRGTFARRTSRTVVLTDSMVAAIPEKHRPLAGTEVVRTFVDEVQMPPFASVKNRTDVVFHGAEPEVQPTERNEV